MRAVVAVALVLVCVAAAALLWWPRGDGLVVPSHAAGVGDVDAKVSAEAERGAQRASSADVDGEAGDAATPQRVRAAADEGVAPGNVRVVRFDDGQPVAGARVLYLDPSFDWKAMRPADYADWQQLANTDTEAWFLRAGGEVRTRSDGTCDVPLGDTGTQVMARSGELFARGYAMVKDQATRELRLREDRDLRVRILTADGLPAARLRVQFTSHGEPAKSPRSFVFGRSDGDGRIVHRHCQEFAGDQEHLRGKLSAVVIGGESAPVDVDMLDPPDEVVLRLMPTGVVRVRLRDAAGEPLDAELLGKSARVLLDAYDSEPLRREDEVVHYSHGGDEGLVQAGGVAEFATVPLDKFVVARLGHQFTSARGAGPTQRAPVVELVLQETANAVILTGELREAGGAPFAGREFQVVYRYGHGSGSGAGTTDELGRFRCNLGGYVDGQLATMTFRSGRTRGAAELSIELPPRELRAGHNDLGEVVFADARVLLAGRFVCDEGVDARHLYLQVERKVDERWHQDWQLRPETRDDGTFELRGSVPDGEPLRLVVQKGAFLPVDPIDCEVGDTGITIPLRTAGTVVASLYFDDPKLAQKLTTQCRRDGGPEPDQHDRFLQLLSRQVGGVQQDGGLLMQWHGLEPGTYTLTVACAGVEEPLVEVPGLVVGSGPCEDPRLEAIDLRGRLRSIEIRATGPDGAPIVDRDAFVLVPGGEEAVGYNLGNGVVELVTPTSVDLMVYAPGLSAVERRAVSASQTIALPAAPLATLQVELPQPLPDGVHLELRFTAVRDVPRRSRVTLDTGRDMPLEGLFVEAVRVGADGRASVPVRWPGEYRVHGEITGSRVHLSGFEPSTVRLPGDGVTTLKVSASSLERALEMRGR